MIYNTLNSNPIASSNKPNYKSRKEPPSHDSAQNRKFQFLLWCENSNRNKDGLSDWPNKKITKNTSSGTTPFLVMSLYTLHANSQSPVWLQQLRAMVYTSGVPLMLYLWIILYTSCARSTYSKCITLRL